MQNALNEDYSAETEIFYSNHIPNPTSESNAESAREVAEEYGTATDFFFIPVRFKYHIRKQSRKWLQAGDSCRNIIFLFQSILLHLKAI